MATSVVAVYDVVTRSTSTNEACCWAKEALRSGLDMEYFRPW